MTLDFILDAIIEELEKHLALYSRIKVGSLPQRGGIAMYVGSGAPQSVFMDKGTLNTIYATANAKSKGQKQATAALEQIHSYLTRIKEYPSGEDWQIIDVSTSSAPSLIGQECDGDYLYGSILQIKFYYGGHYGK